jgi:hypothetical protein
VRVLVETEDKAAADLHAERIAAALKTEIGHP